jgi:formiminotetrahydrofolate cyclodeaminase
MLDSTATIGAFVNAAAAKQPTPGGGAVTALVGSLAAAMGEMVIQYSLGKKGLEAFEGEFKPALAEFTRARQMLLQLMSEDQQAYEALVAARRLPEGPERRQRLSEALRNAIRVPQNVAATAVAILDLCDKMVNFVNYHLLSDLSVCADLAMAATRCGVYNVRVNLKSVESADERRQIESSISQVLTNAAQLIQRVAPRIWERYEMGS